MNENQTSTPVQSNASRNTFGIPVAIVIAALLIAGAIVFSGKGGENTPTPIDNTLGQQQEDLEITIEPVSDDDHILGNPNAPIVIVEYSDYDCPFCKNFHETMNKIMAEYGKDGKVAWVYRQFPIAQLHPNAPLLSEASECVASLGGNDAFWKFSNSIFEGRSINAQTDITKLGGFAVQAGVDLDQYNACVEAGTFTQKIQDDIIAATQAGAQGTPYSILIAGGQQGVINGAQPYAIVKQMIDGVLTQLQGS